MRDDAESRRAVSEPPAPATPRGSSFANCGAAATASSQTTATPSTATAPQTPATPPTTTAPQASASPRTILVADDDVSIAQALEIWLRGEGYEVRLAADGLEAVRIASTEDVALVIMDVMMPGIDGLSATMRVREQKDIPILMLSAKSEDLDKVAGLGIGADDYVTKPFSPIELLARVKALLRRADRAAGTAAAQAATAGLAGKAAGAGGHEGSGKAAGTDARRLFCSGGLEIDDDAKSVTVDGDEVRLTATEYRILLFLASHAGHVFSIKQIYEAVWKETAYHPENTVAVHIRRIREKIEIDPKNPRYLKVVWGIGYKLEKLP